MANLEHDYAETELLYNKFTRSSTQNALKELKQRLPESPRILDAGCGPGGHFKLFEQFFPEAKIVAIDSSKPHINEARKNAETIQNNTNILKANLESELNLDESSFDLIWSADVIFPSNVNSAADVVKNLKPLLKQNGILAIFYGNWLRQNFIPGHSRLEHKINAACELMYENHKMENLWRDLNHPEKTIKWFQEAGFKDISQSVHTSHYYKPDIPDFALEYVEQVFENDYSNSVKKKGKDAGFTDEEINKWQELSDKENSDYILEREDYHCSINCLLTYGGV